MVLEFPAYLGIYGILEREQKNLMMLIRTTFDVFPLSKQVFIVRIFSMENYWLLKVQNIVQRRRKCLFNTAMKWLSIFL